MSAHLRRSMTRDEFLIWAEGQEGRYEFDGFQPVAMTGGTNNHGLIIRNLHGILYNRLRGRPCQSMTSEGGGIATIGGKVRFPDAAVTCSPIIGTERLLPDPVIVFEVLSPHSARDDATVKKVEYEAVPTIRRYILIDHAKIAVIDYFRSGLGAWESAPPLGKGCVLQLPEVGIVIPVDELYERVSFADEAGA